MCVEIPSSDSIQYLPENIHLWNGLELITADEGVNTVDGHFHMPNGSVCTLLLIITSFLSNISALSVIDCVLKKIGNWNHTPESISHSLLGKYQNLSMATVIPGLTAKRTRFWHI